MYGELTISLSLFPLRKNFIDRAQEAYKRHTRELLHKTHLLCLLGGGLALSHQCSHPTLLSLLLSLLPSPLHPHQGEGEGEGRSCPPSRDHVLKLVRWYVAREAHLRRALVGATDERGTEGFGRLSQVQVFVGLLRSLGFRTRLVLCLQPMPIKATPIKPKSPVGSVGRRRKRKREISEATEEDGEIFYSMNTCEHMHLHLQT